MAVFTDSFGSGSEPATANWTEDVGAWSISGAVLIVTGGDGSFQWLSTKTAAHALLTEVRVNVKRVNLTWGNGPGLRITGSTATESLYYMYVVEDQSATNVYRCVSGTDTLVGSVTMTSTSSDVLSLSATGVGATVTLTVYKNDVAQGSALSDTNAARLVAAGRTGLTGWAAAGQFDDFEVVDLAVVPVAVLTGTMVSGGVTEAEMVSG